MSHGEVATLEVSSKLELEAKMNATTGALRIFEPARRLYYMVSRAPSNSVLDVVAALEPEIQPTPATTPPIFGPELSALIGDLLRGLISLKSDSHDDWEPPSTYAYHRALELLPRAYFQLRLKHPGCDTFPAPFLSTDSVGGIRMALRWKSRQVRVNFGAGPELRSYIYFESPTEHGVQDLQETTLAERLHWLVVG